MNAPDQAPPEARKAAAPEAAKAEATPPSPSKDPGPPAAYLRSGASLRWDVLYALINIAAIPYLLYRRWVLKKDLQGREQKKGYVPERPAHAKRIWIHAVSVGEAKATHVIVKALAQQIPDAEVVFSTTTDTGQEVARKLYGEERVFYYPRDYSGSVTRALDRVKPAVIVLMELEVWPNFTAEAAKRGIPLVVLNGRISTRSGQRYGHVRWLMGNTFLRVRRWMMQSEEYGRRAKDIGVEPARIEVTGNIKYDDVGTQPVTTQERAAARADLALPDDALAILAGSTHPSEERTLLDVYRLLVEKFPKLRLVLAPRHPHRLAEVEKEIAGAGLACLKRSAVKANGAQALDALDEAKRARAVVLIDTMGELKDLYRAADISFVGGSLIPHGGQNPMEPAGMGLPVVYGPYMHNFGEAVLILRDCEGGPGGFLVNNAGELAKRFETLLADEKERVAMGERARNAFVQRQGATDKCVAYLKQLLDEKKA